MGDKDESQLTLLEAVSVKRKLRAPRRRANEIDGRVWTKYSISIWGDIRETAEEGALGHRSLTSV